MRTIMSSTAQIVLGLDRLHITLTCDNHLMTAEPNIKFILVSHTIALFQKLMSSMYGSSNKFIIMKTKVWCDGPSDVLFGLCTFKQYGSMAHQTMPLNVYLTTRLNI